MCDLNDSKKQLQYVAKNLFKVVWNRSFWF